LKKNIDCRADAKIFFKDDNDTLDMTNEAFIVGSSLYTMSIQMLVAKAVLQDPDQYARILPNNVNGLKISSKILQSKA
jgi:hypothetical protein